MEGVTAAIVDRVLAPCPDVADLLGRSHERAWHVVDQRLLELCRLRVASLLGNPSALAERTAGAPIDDATAGALERWWEAACFDATDRACLAFTEQFVFDVASLTDELAAAVVEHLGEAGAVDFTRALLVIEQRQRLQLAWERLFGEDR